MSTSPSSPPRRPRLSLQIKAFASGPSGRASRSLAAAVDVKSPTAFNTLSNVYATTVDRSTPVQEHAPPNPLSGKPSLRLKTQDGSSGKGRSLHTPYVGPYLETPVTAQPMSPAGQNEVCFPSSMSMSISTTMTMTATPPLSAVPPEQNGGRVFTFDSQPAQAAADAAAGAKVPQSATSQNPRRRTTMPAHMQNLPYTHPRSLHSILRNSPLPPLSTKSPVSPRRQSLRLQEKAARRVAYNSPLCQTITTSKYTKSHIDLLTDDATPTTPSISDDDCVLDQTMAYTGNETRDGGQTPGPFEEMRRRMASLRASTPTALSPTGGGIRKRGKKKEKKRRWVWTIGKDGEDADEAGTPVTMSPQLPKTPVVDVPELVVPKKENLVVPVIAVPLPRPRTRMQTARAGGAALQVPRLTIPTPPTPVIPQQVPVEVPRATATPEPVPAVEPPTPSVESTASMSQDSVFESSEDVEMSDASSVFSDWEDAKTVAEVPISQADLDTEMGEETPTTAIRCGFGVDSQGLGSMNVGGVSGAVPV
ncbi:hypothetical protein B0T19DRAFT_432355 [Cercophora scortea]|uniref:Uncharacterized protein n=1 Tax=Cercophora scortea TaxID=314031 RepID=A0AAE0IAG0_9PEZI|nr:hypothetical protein B0T19DRAFT_432355 [Cercophora scortea]